MDVVCNAEYTHQINIVSELDEWITRLETLADKNAYVQCLS